jgi:hypothetical protein
MADGLFSAKPIMPLSPQNLKFDRSVPIVAEPEQIPKRRNSPLNSERKFLTDLARRFFVVRENNSRC